MNIFLILQMRFLAHWILAIAFLLRWEIKFWTPNMTYIISFLLNTKSSRWQVRNLHIFVEIFLLSKGEKSDEKSLLVYEYSLGFKRNKASLDHLSNLTKKVKIEVEISVSSCCSWSGFLRWGGEEKIEIFERGLRGASLIKIWNFNYNRRNKLEGERWVYGFE